MHIDIDHIVVNAIADVDDPISHEVRFDHGEHLSHEDNRRVREYLTNYYNSKVVQDEMV